MKTLINDSEVANRGYYFLLDWNEENKWNTMTLLFDKHRLCDLELHEYVELFGIATKNDLETLKQIKL